MFAAANARGRSRLRTIPQAVAASYDQARGMVVVQLSTGLELAFPPQQAQGLEIAAAEDLAAIEINPSGFGLHFPKLDADLYLPALLEGLLGSKACSARKPGPRPAWARREARRRPRPSRLFLVTANRTG